MAIHSHVCSSCGDALTCCCPDKRQNDRFTGQERKILCLRCNDLETKLGKDAVLEKVQ